MPEFQAISHADPADLKDVGTLGGILQALTVNVEILTGQRGMGVGRAVTNDALGVVVQNNQLLPPTGVRPTSGPVTSAAGGVPTFTDFAVAKGEITQIATDIGKIQRVLNDLIKNMERR